MKFIKNLSTRSGTCPFDEKGEKPFDALMRELEEEIGVIPDVQKVHHPLVLLAHFAPFLILSPL